MLHRNASATRLAHKRSAPDGTAGLAVRVALTAAAAPQTGILLLLSSFKEGPGWRIRNRGRPPQLPAAFVRDDMQGLIISSATQSQLQFPVAEC